MRERPTPLPLAPATLAGLAAKLKALEVAGYAYAVVDTPPAITDAIRAVVALADLVLIPVKPSPHDLRAVGRTVEIARGGGKAFCFVLTQAKGNALLTVQAMAALSEHGVVAPAVMHDRVDYANSMTDGRTMQETDPRGAARRKWRTCGNSLNSSSLAGATALHRRGVPLDRDEVRGQWGGLLHSGAFRAFAKARGVVLGNPRLAERPGKPPKRRSRLLKRGMRPTCGRSSTRSSALDGDLAGHRRRPQRSRRSDGAWRAVARRIGRARPRPMKRMLYFRPRRPESSWGRPGAEPRRGASQNEKTTLVAKLAAAPRRKRATGVKVDGRKSHAEARPEVVKRAKDLAQPKGQRGLSLRAISKALAAEGHLNERGKPFAAKSVASMLASQRKASARRRAPRRAMGGGRRPHDRVRGTAGSVACPSNWRSGSACLPCYCAVAATGDSRAVAIRQRRAQAKSMLIPRATPSTSSWGVPGAGPIVAHHSRSQTPRPPFLDRRELMGSPGLSTGNVCFCLCLAARPRIGSRQRKRGDRRATSRSSGSLGRARDLSDNGWIAFAAAEAWRRVLANKAAGVLFSTEPLSIAKPLS